jgi:hypothetical protein
MTSFKNKLKNISLHENLFIYLFKFLNQYILIINMNCISNQ